MPAQPKRYALLVGNDRYADFAELKAPAADVEGLRRVLQDPDIGGFEVKVLMNPGLRHTQEAISELFALRAQRLRRQDRPLLPKDPPDRQPASKPLGVTRDGGQCLGVDLLGVLQSL